MPRTDAAPFEPKTIEEKVIAIVCDELCVERDEDVTPNAHLVDDLGADSLDLVELTMRCEEEFGIEIPDDDAESLVTVGKLIQYVKDHKEE